MQPDIIDRLTMLQATYPDMPAMCETLEQAKQTIQQLRAELPALVTDAALAESE